MSYTVFLSYSVYPQDYGLVTHVANLLWQNGAQVFIPDQYPRYGETPSRTVAAQIEASDFVIAIVTSPTSRPTSMLQEMRFARARDKAAMALVEQGVNTEALLPGVPSVFFDRWSYFDSAAGLVEHVNKVKRGKEQETKWLGGLLLGGLVLWLISQAGRGGSK